VGKPIPELVKKIIKEAIAIQQIPSPTFEEAKRARYVKNRFVDENFSEVFIDSVNNVYARIKGGEKHPVVVSAHLDTVFDSSCDLSVRIEEDKIFGPGIGDNSLGVAFLLMMKHILQCMGERPEGDIILVANACEEGTGDLRGMKEAFARTIKENPIAYIVLEGSSGADCIYTRGVGSIRFKISAHGRGGHSWHDFGNSSAVHGLVKLAAVLTELSVTVEPRSTFNIGVITGGTSINTIAQTASLLLDLRSETCDWLDHMVQQVKQMIDKFSMDDITITTEKIGDRPSGMISVASPLISLCHSVFLETGFNDAKFKSGSTDANIPFSENVPAVCIGICDGQDVHKPSECLMTGSMDRAVEKVGKIVSRVWQMEKF